MINLTNLELDMVIHNARIYTVDLAKQRCGSGWR